MRRYKKGDLVKIIAGKDKEKQGKILAVRLKANKVVVEGGNIITKHKRKDKNSEGGIVKIPAPLHESNVMLVCPKCSKPSAVNYQKIKNKKVRVCKSCKESIDK